MTRIGFAYNQKPEPSELEKAGERIPRISPAGSDEPTAREDEPPSSSDEFAEWDSPETIDAVAGALSGLGDVIRLEATMDFPRALCEAAPDIVFNIAEGSNGVNRESHVPAICEFYGIPYSGSDPLTLSLCLDKARTKEVLGYHGVPTARFVVVHDTTDLPGATRPLCFPLFVKPVHEGSSKGITEANFCRTQGELEAQTAHLLATCRQPVIVEEYLPGAEFTCAVLGNGSDAKVLPIVGIDFATLPPGAVPIYGFEAKWIWDRPERPLKMFDCPPNIDDSLTRAIERVTLDAYRVLGCRDWSRIDVRLDDAGAPNVVEVNPLPGILPDPADNSCFPKAARAAGLSYDELIQTCLKLAAARKGVALGRAQLDARVPKRPRRSMPAHSRGLGVDTAGDAVSNRLTA